MNRLWIVLPTYFDGLSFEKVYHEALQAIKKIPEFSDSSSVNFVLIDDSAGQDPEIKKVTFPQVTIVTPPYNLGHQAALIFALRKLHKKVLPEDYLITMDSDGEDPAHRIGDLIAPLLIPHSPLHRVVLAERTQREEPPLFRILYFFFRLLFKTLTGLVVKNGNFVAFRGWFLKSTIFHPHFDQAYASTFRSLRLNWVAVPLPRAKRHFGQTKMGYIGLITHGFRMLMPFSEQIATRGSLFSFIIFSLLLPSTFLFPNHFWIPFLCLLAALSFCTFSLFFTTFSQTKSRNFQSLLDYSDRDL